MVLIVHQGGVTCRRGVLNNAQPHLFDRVARNFPDLPIVIAHMGQPWVNETIPLLRKHPTMYADVSARSSRPWQLHGILMAALDYGVQDKILFGSDYPTFFPKDHLEGFLHINDRVGSVEIPEKTLQEIAFARPLSLLGLD